MSLHSHPSPPPVPGAPIIALRVSVKCDSVAAFSERYWRLVKDDRILIVANRQRAPGTRIRFHITLKDGSDALRGEGRVVRMRKTPRGAEWVELQFVPLDEPSKKLVAVLQALRAAHGKAPHTAAAGLEFEEHNPTSPIDREAFDEFDAKKATDRIDRERLNLLLASTPSPSAPPPLGQALPPPLPPIPQPPMPPPLPDGVLSALTPEGPILDEEDLEPYIEEWQVLPTGKVRKITRGEMLISPSAPMPAIDPEEAVQVGLIAPHELKEGIAAERRKKKGGHTTLLILGMLLGIALGLLAAIYFMGARPPSL